LVEAGRLRFDFSHFSAVAPEELSEIEVLANGRLIAGEPVTTTITSREEAERMGALAFFGDKYGERVRVVKVGEFSIEFCGGTHTHTAGQVGPLVVMGESSIGSNLRRVEALTGEDAYRHLVGMRAKLGEVGQLLRAPSLEVPGRVRSLLERLEDLDQELSAYRMRERSSIAEQVVAEQSEVVGSGRLVTSERPDLSPEQLRLLALSIRERIARGVVVMGSTHDGKAGLVAAVTKDLVAEGVSAAQILRSAAQILGGGGSRDPELSQAGGPKGELLGKALDVARETATQAMAAR
jgi:alanyl-tRNA synthetase